jgi:hypothetical protein
MEEGLQVQRSLEPLWGYMKNGKRRLCYAFQPLLHSFVLSPFVGPMAGPICFVNMSGSAAYFTGTRLVTQLFIPPLTCRENSLPNQELYSY